MCIISINKFREQQTGVCIGKSAHKKTADVYKYIALLMPSSHQAHWDSWMRMLIWQIKRIH